MIILAIIIMTVIIIVQQVMLYKEREYSYLADSERMELKDIRTYTKTCILILIEKLIEEDYDGESKRVFQQRADTIQTLKSIIKED